MHWQTSRYLIDLSRPQVMAIVNLTPDSFSDGGEDSGPLEAIGRCERLLADGATMLDLGAESTRPGSQPVSVEQELARLLPVLDGVLSLGCPVSIDTNKPEVMAAALGRGADIINDVRALRAPGALGVVAAHQNCGVCLMHMRGEPASMQDDPVYADVVAEVSGFLVERMGIVEDAGISLGRVVLDPGIGFGKTPSHNIELLRRQREFCALGRPLLVGWSRKGTLGLLTGRPVHERQAASVAAALAAVEAGARILRVHDVAATADALKVWEAAGRLAG